MERRETEFKLLLPGPEAFDLLRGWLPRATTGGATDALPVRQRNRFFDTQQRALAAADCALRLRSEAGRWTLTAKGPAEATDSGAAVSMRAEQEFELDAASARQLLGQQACPLRVLEQAPVPGASALVARMRTAVADARLDPIGGFDNLRTRVGPLAVELECGRRLLVFEFDRTLFADGRVDHELEVEVSAADARAVDTWLRTLFLRADLAWRPASSKAARCFGNP